MGKPHGRQIKKKVGDILLLNNKKDAFDRLRQIPDQILASPLFSYFYSMDDLIKFRSTLVMGYLAKRLSKTKIENARIILRRLMWNLNDESGGIGWGSAEAMGEILSLNNKLAEEFESILFSYINPKGNFIEHEMLQRGPLWGIGTYLGSCPADNKPDKSLIQCILPFFDSKDSVKRGYALRALLNEHYLNIKLVPKHILSDDNIIPFFDGWNLLQKKISDLAE